MEHLPHLPAPEFPTISGFVEIAKVEHEKKCLRNLTSFLWTIGLGSSWLDPPTSASEHSSPGCFLWILMMHLIHHQKCFPMDLLPGHFAYAEYRRRLQKHGELSSDPHPEFLDYGILETEGSSLLGDEEPSSWEIRRSCLEWCSQYNIEYIEACASNAFFDKCLSVDGDLQGLERLFGALSGHMWPGMVLKSGNEISATDILLRFLFLERGSSSAATETVAPAAEDVNEEHKTNGSADIVQSEIPLQEDARVVVPEANETDEATGSEDDTCLGLEELEQLMSEIGNMRNRLRLMPDFQRREVAAKLAMKVATIFGDGNDNEGNFD
ncbi:hypothetical protein NE237_020306 [Protea cynaroides]|uniref:Uncharacterized protein n=1 Tax=Protea cynaroides TaxID=273540 RepID=A0A9Q0H5Q6_9MAGN|nr:hypothetical protein NE237_020306 [Protea cynaroides]